MLVLFSHTLANNEVRTYVKDILFNPGIRKTHSHNPLPSLSENWGGSFPIER